MEIHRAEHRQNFTVISNRLIKDNRLSEKARLFLIFVLSLPEDWNFSVSGIAVQFGKSPGAIRRLLRELEEHGYLIRKQNRNEEGLFEAGQFVFYEEPVAGNHFSVSGEMDNRTRVTVDKALLNKERQITNQAIKKDKPMQISPDGLYGTLHNVRLSAEELTKLSQMIPDSYEGLIEDLSVYIGSKGDRYKSHYGAILSWDRAQRKKNRKGLKITVTKEMVIDGNEDLHGNADSCQ